MTQQSSDSAASLPAVAEATRAFVDRFGGPPDWIGAAPGRVNLIGEHTDYNDGFVLPMAIQRGVIIAGRRAPNGGSGIRAFSSTLEEWADIPIESAGRDPQGSWANYMRGVVQGFRARGAVVPPADVLITSNLPLGGGLSSSAALEVATATLLEAATGLTLPPLDKAKLCQRAEHEYALVPCGLMDQLASVFGDPAGALLIDCRSSSIRVVRVPPELSVIICNTGVRHALAEGAYAKRRAECSEAARLLGVSSLRDATLEALQAAQRTMDRTLFRRAHHVVSENARTVAAAAALERGNSAEAGRLFYESHASLRDDYEVSCFELDVVVDSARALGPEAGVFGARMTGGGFGGSAVVLATGKRAPAVMEAVARAFREKTGRELDAFVAEPGPGARVLTGNSQ